MEVRDITEFMPHGHCFLWKKDILALHVISDAVTAISYFVIPFLLILFVYRNYKKLPFQKILLLFSGFIFACGTVHIFSIYTMWVPSYWAFGIAKAIMAGFSVLTALCLVPAIRGLIRHPNPYVIELKRVNAQLLEKVLEKESIEVELTARAQQLEELNETMIGREVKMAELKQEIQVLKKQLRA